MSFARITAAAALLASLVSPVWADDEVDDAAAKAPKPYLAQASRPGNFTSSAAGEIQVPIRSTGANVYDLTVKTEYDKQYIKITYNAECGVLGVGAWVSIRITVDGTNVTPTPSPSTDFALCTGSSAGSYYWVAAVRQAVFRIPAAGTHVVRVYATRMGGGTQIWLGDSSLIVE